MTTSPVTWALAKACGPPQISRLSGETTKWAEGPPPHQSSCFLSPKTANKCPFQSTPNDHHWGGKRQHGEIKHKSYIKKGFSRRRRKKKTIKHSEAVGLFIVSRWKIRGDKSTSGITWFTFRNWYCQDRPRSRREVHGGCPFYYGCPSQCLHNSSFILCLESQGDPINTANKLSSQLAWLRCPSCFCRRTLRPRSDE